jgi:type IV pilus assembly protein PilB
MLNKRSDRKPGHRAQKNREATKVADRAPSSQSVATGTNGNAPDAASRTPDRLASRGLQDLLLRRNLVTEGQIDQAFETDSDSASADLGSALVSLGFIDERDLIDARAELYGMAVANLRQITPEVEALALIPDSMAREHFVIPVTLDALGLHVAMSDQPTPELLALLDQTSGTPIQPMLAPLSEIRRAIDNNYRAIGGLDHLVQAFEAVETTRKRTLDTATTAAEVVLEDDAPVVQVVGRILTQAMRDRASDVHIEPTEGGLRVRYRIDGALKQVLMLPASMGVGLISRIKIMAGMNIVERRRPQDGQLRTEIDGKEVDVRVATVSTIWGEKCVMRLLDRTRSVLRLGELGMPADSAETYANFVRAPFGMVLCAGPTGSGKTTTLYATLTEISDESRNVMTIEDPVEYIFPAINQIQTNEQAGLTFATGLRSILRQDPDVILVGEIRDVETARIAVQSALTGHLVLSSLHATDAVSALHRFLDMGIESFLVASSVIGIVGQRLVRRICPSCRVSYTLNDAERAFYEESGGPEKTDFVRGAGCNFCSGTGYQERIGVYELLRITPEIKRLVVGWATQDELRKLAQRQGMRSLREEAIDLVAQDVTTVSEVIRSIYSS